MSKPQIHSYKECVIGILKFSGPYALARLTVAIRGVAFAILLAMISAHAVEAGALIASVTYCVMGTFRGLLLATGIFVGKVVGKENNDEISSIMQRSWLLSFTLALVATPILFNLNHMLAFVGISSVIATTVQQFFDGHVIGVFPTLFIGTVVQLLVATGNSSKALNLRIIYTTLSIILGYIFAFTYNAGVYGLGLGIAVSSWVILAISLLYLMNVQPYKAYRLFSKHSSRLGITIKEFLKIGVPTALQSFSEWGNIIAITLLFGLIGNQYLSAEQVSVQMLALFNVMLLGLAHAGGIKISQMLGQIEKHNGQPLDQNIIIKNLHSFSSATVLIGLVGALVVGIVFVLIPEQLSMLFLHSSAPNIRAMLSISRKFLIINAVGIFFDSIRNLYSGLLRGIRDVVFAPVISFISMSGFALLLGYILCLHFHFDPIWIFITRVMGILMASICICYRWYRIKFEVLFQ